MINVAVVGMGGWGKELFRHFNDGVNSRVSAVCSLDICDIEALGKVNVQHYTDLDTLLRTEKVDALVIATPPTEHKSAALVAASKGIHVFCEKPMAASIEDCDAMIEACQESGVLLMVAFKHRFAKAFSALKHRESDLGDPLWAMYTYPLWRVDDPGWKFKEDGCRGVAVENMVHAIDALRYLAGDIARVYAEGDNFIFTDVKPPDSAIIALRFCNGAIGGLGGGCTSDRRISKEYLDIHYEHGIAQISGRLDQPYHLSLLMRDATGVEQYFFDGSDGVAEEVQHFIECVQRGEQPLCTGSDGRKAVEAALAIIESIRCGRPIAIA